MPYDVRYNEDTKKWEVYNTETGVTKAQSDTEENARTHMRIREQHHKEKEDE